MITYVVNVVAIKIKIYVFSMDHNVVSVVVKLNFIFFTHHRGIVNVVAVGTKSLFSG